MKRFLWPLGLFLSLMLLLGAGLHHDPRDLPSPLIGQPAPAFTLNQLAEPDRRFGPHDMKGQVWLLNVWASWCASCREEHALLVDFARRGLAPVVGLDYMDTAAEATKWLQQHGNPYLLSVQDTRGRVGIDYGVYGVPETFVIDQRGRIRLKLSGPVTAELLNQKIVPLIKELQRG